MDKRAALRAMGAATLACTAAFALTACKDDSKPKFQGVDVTGADYAKDIPLTDVDGKKRSLKDFSGKVVAVFFGYTQCPDVCPTTLQELLEVKQALGADGDKLQAVFVSLDPERDTPEVLKAYLANFDESFVGLSGTADEIAAVVRTSRSSSRRCQARSKAPTPWTIRLAPIFSIPRAACACTSAMARDRSC